MRETLTFLVIITILSSSLSHHLCGESSYHPGVTSLIAGGESFKPSQWPWLASLFHKNKFICGGTIVSSKVIVTAAHCVQDKGEETERLPKDSFFIAGRHDLTAIVSEDEIIAINKFFVHPHWKHNQLNYDGDLALVILSLPLEFSETIAPACLHPKTYRSSELFGRQGSIAGWGATGNETIISMEKPKIIDITIVEDSVCSQYDSAFTLIMSARSFCSSPGSGKCPCKGKGIF